MGEVVSEGVAEACLQYCCWNTGSQGAEGEELPKGWASNGRTKPSAISAILNSHIHTSKNKKIIFTHTVRLDKSPFELKHHLFGGVDLKRIFL